MPSIVKRINPIVKIFLYEKCFIANNIDGEQTTIREAHHDEKNQKRWRHKTKG
jgi:hypothetical protein